MSCCVVAYGCGKTVSMVNGKRKCNEECCTVSSALYKAFKEDWLYYRFDSGGHLLSRNALGGLMPEAGGSEDCPSPCGGQQCGIYAGY